MNIPYVYNMYIYIGLNWFVVHVSHGAKTC